METAVTVVGAGVGDVAANISHKTTCVTNTHSHSGHNTHSHSGHNTHPHGQNYQHETLNVCGRRRALVGNAATAGFMAAAVGATMRRGRMLGFKKLFYSISAPKDIVYIGALYGVGDISQQLITQSRRTLGEPLAKRRWDLSVDWKGAASAGLVGGSVIGTFNHYWYTFLDKLIQGTSFKSVVRKVLLDQMSLPIPIATFMLAMAIVKAKPDVFEELKAKFFTTYLYGSILWPMANFFNFMFVPRFHRILFIGCVEFFWTNVMCFMVDLEVEKEGKGKDKDKDKENDPLSQLD